MSTNVHSTPRSRKAARKTVARRSVTAIKPDALLSLCSWNEVSRYPLLVANDVTTFSVKRGDYVWCRHRDPDPGELIGYTGMDGGPYIGVARFHKWQFDEMLVTDADDGLSFIRPATAVVIERIESAL